VIIDPEADRLCRGLTTRQSRFGDGARHRAGHDHGQSHLALRWRLDQPQCERDKRRQCRVGSGANSFTEGQARRRIEDRGYTNVDRLHKDQNSIRQAEAMKGGRRVRVGVDFRGNVIEENR
jgi:hypothetical protein